MSPGQPISRNNMPTKRAPERLKLKLLAIVLAATCLTQIAVTLLLTMASIISSERDFHSRTIALLNSRAQIIGTLVWRFQYDELKKIVDDIMLESPVASVRIFDTSGTMISAMTDSTSSQINPEVISIPLIYMDGMLRADAGRFEVTLTSASMLTKYSSRLIEATLLAVFSACAIIIAVSSAMDWLVNRPLRVLLNAIDRARETGDRVSIRWHRNDEIGTVIEAFNAMQEANDIARHEVLEANHKLKVLSEQDDLTGLPNRRSAQLAIRRLPKSQAIAVHFIDLDEFKAINDTLGHGAGDTLLSAIGKVMLKATTPDARFYRMGGDEFIVLQSDAKSGDDALEFARGVHQLLARSYNLGKHLHSLKLSIGTVFADDGIIDSDQFFSLADVALYEAKRRGRNRVILLTEEMRRLLDERQLLERDVASAIRDGSIAVYFQPQLDANTGEVVGFETLSRWEHPTHGQVSPEQFVPLIKEVGLSIEHGNLVIRRACEALVLIQKVLGRSFIVAVNVGAEQLLDQNFVPQIIAEVTRHNLSPSCIEVEITESELIQNFEEANDVIRSLRNVGVTVAIDDFGTGYSSLSYLSKLPIDRIKIDKSFISQITEDLSARAVVELIAGVARTLSLTVVAEGIEREEEVNIIRKLGIQYVQGYRFAKGLPINDLIEFLREHLSNREKNGLDNLLPFKRKPS